MFERIVVAFDGSPPARRALTAAIEVAGRFHSHLTIAFVRPAGSNPTDSVLESLVPMPDGGKTFATVVDETRAQATARGATAVESMMLGGEVAETLLAWIDRHHPDLVIVGSRELSRGRRLLLGSVSSALVQEASCPILVVRGRTVPSRPAGSAGGS